MADITPWTPEQLDELTRLWTEGHTVREIGRRMHRTANSIVGKVNRLGLAPRQSPIRKRNAAA